MGDGQVDNLRLIDQFCDVFESALSSESEIAIEDVLLQARESIHGDLLRELLILEIAYRDEPDLTQLQSEYLNRFPDYKTLVAKIVQPPPVGQLQGALSSPPSASSMIGREFGRYRIIEPLGKGGMGVVYRATDTQLQRDVALKFPGFSTTNTQLLERFYSEARAAATIRHANICPIYDVGEIDGQHYISMALIVGKTLSSVSNNAGPMVEIEIAQLVTKLAEALQAAHVHGIVHRDLKPANIMIDDRDQPIIMDFGLARRETESDARITKTGTVMGTPAYMSPEQVEGLDVGPASDIYSLGVIVFELATGQLPFQGTIGKIMSEILGSDPSGLSELAAGISPRFEEICQTMMAKKATDRYATMAEVAADFDEFLETINQPGATARRKQKEVDSLAILPLANVGGDEELEYLSDGITETLINSMSRVSNLRVMARSTVFQYKGQELDPHTIGKNLNVRAVLTGRIQKRGDQLVFKTELVNAGDGSQLWGERYIRPLAELLDLEEEIASEIAKGLKLQLSPAQRQELGKKKTDNPQAYQHYLKGRYHWNKRNATDLQKAIEHFEDAIAEDSNYAQAYAGLADSYGLSIAWGNTRPHAVCPKARQMATKALEIDGSLADAHTSLGYINVVYDWDWPAAEKQYRRAIELNPNYVNAHHWLAYLLMCWQRFSEAEDSFEKARQLDPLSLIVSANAGYCKYFERLYDEAIDQFENSIALDANLAPPHYYLGLTLIQTGNYAASIDALTKSIELSGGVPGDLGSLGYAYGLEGNTVEAVAMIDRLLNLENQGYLSAFHIGLIHLAMKDVDSAFACFDRAVTERDFYLIYLKVDPRLDSIRENARFADLFARVGLPNDR